MSQLNSGLTNMIAVSDVNKNNMFSAYETNIATLKPVTEVLPVVEQTQPVSPFGETSPQASGPIMEPVQPSVVPQEPVFAPPIQPEIVNTPSIQPDVAMSSVTNADVLSQSFQQPDSIIVEQPKMEIPNNQLTDIVYDIAKVQDDLDKIVAKIFASMPDKEINQSIDVNNEPFIIQEEPMQPNQNIINQQVQQMTPFAPVSENIFDVPQTPSV